MFSWHFHVWNTCLIKNQRALILRMERNFHNFGCIFSTALISHFLWTKAKGLNVRQFPTRSNFQILNIMSSSRGISFYFPPLEVVHPVTEVQIRTDIYVYGDPHEQVTWGQNIVADGWAGASSPHPHPMPPKNTCTQKQSKMFVFPLFDSCVTDQRTDRRTDGPTDGRTKPLIELRVRN